MKEFLRKELRGFQSYKVEENIYKYKLDANESPFNLPGAVRERLIDWINGSENLNIYPDTDSLLLRQKIADVYGLEKDNIMVTVGSDQLIDYVTKAFLDKGDSIIVPSPTFSMYEISASLNHGCAVKVPLVKQDSGFCYDIERFIEAANANKAKVVFICSPNNPTGNIIPLDDINRLVEQVACPVVIDEAYAEFDGSTAVELVTNHNNLLIAKTFSKAYGIAGIRLGYGIGSKDMINALETVRPPFNVSTVAQIIGNLVLENRSLYAERIQFLKDEKNRVSEALKCIGFIKQYESNANFIYFESGIDVQQKLKQCGFLIRSHGKSTDGKYCCRLSIGGREANTAVIEALEGLNV